MFPLTGNASAIRPSSSTRVPEASCPRNKKSRNHSTFGDVGRHDFETALTLAMEAILTESGRQREDDWFRENERKLLEEARHAREEREAERKGHEAKAERDRLKAAHYMKCPK